MANGITTLPRAGTVEVIQEFATAPATPARPILNPVIIGSAFQIETQKFAGFYTGRTQVLDELVGTGDGVTTQYTLDNTPVIIDTVEVHVGSITGTLLVQGTDYTVLSDGSITLTPAGLVVVGLNELHAGYFFAPAQTFVYPDIKQGAEVENPSTDVTVFLKTVEDVFDITNGFGVIIGSTTVTVPGDIQPERTVTDVNGQVEVLAATDTIVDPSSDFFDLDVRPGDILRFITNAVNIERSDSIVATDAQDHTVLTIPASNTLTMSPDIAAQGGKVEYTIIRKGSQNGDIEITYRARRRDLEQILLEFESIEDLETQLGPIQPDNPLAFGISIAIGATDKTVFAMMVKDQDDLTDHQKALDILEGEEVYTLIPLTNNAAIHSVYASHVDNASKPENMRERITIFSTKARERKEFSDLSSTGSMRVGSTRFEDPNARFLTDGVPVGAVIRLQSPSEIELADVPRAEPIISGVVSQTELDVIQAVTQGTLITGENVGTGTGAQINFQLAATQDVIISSVNLFLNGVQADASDFTVTPAGAISFLLAPGLGVVISADYEIETISAIQYTVESQNLTNFEIAQDVAAVGAGFTTRRVTITFAEIAIADDGTEVEPFFLNCALGGMISAVAPNQPLANAVIPGFTAIKHLRRFTDTHFGIMAANGISVFLQNRDTSPIVLRNWISADPTNVNTRERSIANMADFYAKFVRRNVQAIAGRFNITEDFIDNMLRPGINGANRELITAGFVGQKTQIISIEQSTVAKDQLFVLVELELFAPANKITITVRIL